MVINDLHVFCAGVSPTKADAPLIVDAYAVFAVSLAFQGLKAIARGYAQVLQSGSDLELSEFAPSNCLDVDEALYARTLGKGRSVVATERPNHGV